MTLHHDLFMLIERYSQNKKITPESAFIEALVVMNHIALIQNFNVNQCLETARVKFEEELEETERKIQDSLEYLDGKGEIV